MAGVRGIGGSGPPEDGSRGGAGQPLPVSVTSTNEPLDEGATN